MGLAKNYLRFVHESTFGVVAASQVGASIKYLHMRGVKDRFIAAPANENVLFWDLKTKQVINQLTYDDDNSAEVTVFECFHGGHPRTNLIAVGYANGHVRVFEYETGGLKATFTGHRTAISALAFDKDGSRLASGGKDCNIVLWDLVGEKGLFALKGHKNSISKLSFLFNEEHSKDLIVSSSVDAVSTIKFWDLQTQHCFCTLPGKASGVWSFVILRNGTRLVVGSTSPELKVYSIKFLSQEESKTLDARDLVSQYGQFDDENELGSSELEYGLQVKHMGNILRNTEAVSNRVQDIAIDEEESIMICHSVDKNIELYGLRNDEDALTYAKKQAKKASRKLAKKKRMTEDETDPLEEKDIPSRSVNSLDDLDTQNRVDCEFNRKIGSQRLDDKIKAVAIIRSQSKDLSKRYKLSLMLSSNKIECYQLDPSVDDKKQMLNPFARVEHLSHRKDVRAVSISPDNSLIMSASGGEVKIWRLDTRSCIATIETGYATCCTFANADNITANYQNRFAIVGTKQGALEIIDISEAEVVDAIQICDSHKPLNAIHVRPDRSGIVCGGDDGIARFFNYTWRTTQEEGQNRVSLGIEPDRELPFQEGITCVKISANNNLLAVALLDSTVRVHFVDTFKYFLTMYGHKFPVTTMDLSDDNTLIATGSADKNIKIWGLDFGDCHKSIFAHDDAITCVRFVPKTHYLFSCGRDNTIKQWDCDHFIKIQTLRKHQADIWCLDVSPNGKYVVTGSHDKSLRLYRKTEEILVPAEEDETQREIEDERNVFEKQENIVVGEIGIEAGFATKMTIDTVKSADRLIEAIDVYGREQDKELEYAKQCELAESKGEPRPTEPERDPLLMTALTTDYNRFMLETLRRIRSSELEEILLTLPFDYVRQLLIILTKFLERRWDVELMVRCAVFLLKVNFGQIAASPTLVPVVYKLKSVILDRSKHLRDCAGFNLTALDHLSQDKKYKNIKVERSFY